LHSLDDDGDNLLFQHIVQNQGWADGVDVEQGTMKQKI
jgi:hypothetical protein